jgi:hypothetical protein
MNYVLKQRKITPSVLCQFDTLYRIIVLSPNSPSYIDNAKEEQIAKDGAWI